MPVRRWYAERAWLGGDRIAAGVLLEADGDRLVTVRPASDAPVGELPASEAPTSELPAGEAPASGSPAAEPPADAVRLRGVTIPGLANAHSHAFHRALRGRTSTAGDFWSWRRQMYAVADRLDPDSYLALARATYAEMALAGITVVGEFHYLHHAPGGARYDDPNAMAAAVIAAAAEAGVRLTLLDTCYLRAGMDGAPLEGAQQRFGDGDAAGWAARVDGLRESGAVRVGAAIHSVRAVPAEQFATVTGWAASRSAPLHLHLSEQPAENAACLAATGRSPTVVCADSGVLGPATTAVHATHVTGADIAALASAGTTVCLCPTTERDLADGVGPAGTLAAAGIPLALGSDSQAVIDLFEEARAVELDERLVTLRRGSHRPAGLLAAATAGGAAALGWPDAGRLEVGALADFTTVRLDTVRTAGLDREDPLAGLVFAATASDVSDVVVGGEAIVVDGRHVRVGDVAAALRAAIAPLWR